MSVLFPIKFGLKGSDPAYAKSYYEDVATMDKKLIWLESPSDAPFAQQFDFYDDDTTTNNAVTEKANWFRTK